MSFYIELDINKMSLMFQCIFICRLHALGTACLMNKKISTTYKHCVCGNECYIAYTGETRLN